MATLAAQLAGDLARINAGTVAVCGYSCACHGHHACRRAQHPDEHGDRSPHIADDGDGGLIQWVGPCDDDLVVPDWAPAAT